MLEAIESISLTFASLVAAYGVIAWRREHRGKREFEVAEDILTSSYEFRNELFKIRYWHDIGALASRNPIDPTLQKDMLAALNHSECKDQESKEIAFKLQSTTAKALVLFGNEVEFPISDLLAHRMMAKNSRDALIWYLEKNIGSIERLPISDLQASISMAFASIDEDDSISIAMKNAIAELENILLPQIRKKSLWMRWKAFLTRP